MNSLLKQRIFLILCALLHNWPVFAQSPRQTITLKEGLHLAFARNETVLIAQENLSKSQQQVREAAADAFPQVSTSLQYTRNWLLPTFIFDTPQGQQRVSVGAHNQVIGNIGIRQPIYSGGKTFAALHIARLFRKYSQESVRSAHQQVHADVETTFYDLLLAEELVRVTQLALERAQANLNRVQKLHQAGRVSEYDVLRAQVQVAELRPDSIQAENNVALTALAFKNLVGLTPETPIKTTGEFRAQSSVKDSSSSQLVSLSLKFRPEILQQRLEVQMRQKAQVVSQAGSRPSLDLLVNGQWEAQKNDFNFSSGDFNQSWFSGLTLSVPVFDGFRTGAKVAQSRADLRRAELIHQQIERSIHLSVLQAQQQCQEAQLRKNAQVQTVDLARRGLSIAESRYANGVGTQLEMIDAQLSLQRAEADLAIAQRDLAVALVLLEYRVGILGEDLTSTQQEKP